MANLDLAKSLMKESKNLTQLETICICCKKLFVMKENDIWKCWFCHIENNTLWKCKNNHLENNQQELCSNQFHLVLALNQKKDFIIDPKIIHQWSETLITNKKGEFKRNQCSIKITYLKNHWEIFDVHDNDCIYCIVPKLNSSLKTQHGPNRDFLETLALLDYTMLS